MDQHPNVERMGRYLAAWADPDPNGLLAMCSPDVTMHVGGSHSLTGTYRGHEGTSELHRRSLAVSDQSFQVQLEDILADDGYAMAIMSLTLGQGDHTLRNTTMGAVKLDSDGLVTEAWYLSDDQRAEDDFMQ